ncbi:GNAT family N-acetyltransferase [Streptomyces sp. SBT349]|uniref:GNAT family N-acetyltransferase n=1 Tax=Streptomyces sp. SBT349 TaxID=1580539 RepID=UPI00066CE0C5|nr:GNAT family N-acetyltransferase [Streptomyces sp. SBT349]
MSAAEIRRVTEVADVVAAEALFDGPPRVEWAERFLDAPGHHLFIAYAKDDGEPVGMVTGVEMTHPDKGTEMFLYELGVAETHRLRGIGRSLVEALADTARARGCWGMWVAVDADNDAALATYRSAGGVTEGAVTIPAWEFGAGR